jgi:hypothetical protein
MKFPIIATIFAALATTGYAAAADAIPSVTTAAVVDETAHQVIMNDGSEENCRVLRVNEPAPAANDEAPEGEAPAMEGTGNKRDLGTDKNGANKKDYSGQSCHLCCEDDDYHC